MMKFRTRNLIPYPYYESTHIDNGITWTDNGDGTVTATGTATANSLYQMRIRTDVDGNMLTLKRGTYTLSGVPNEITSNSIYITVVRTNPSTNNAQTLGLITAGEGSKSFSVEEDSAVTIGIAILSGQTISNLVFKPQLEVGEVATEYVPYEVELQTMKFRTRNLIDSNDVQGFVRCTGTYENSSATITSNTENAFSYFYRDYFLKKGVTYTLSADCDVYGMLSCMYVYNEGRTQFRTIESEYGTDNIVLTFTPTEDFYCIRVQFGIANATIGTQATFTEMQLEAGEVATEYVPYEVEVETWIHNGVEVWSAVDPFYVIQNGALVSGNYTSATRQFSSAGYGDTARNWGNGYIANGKGSVGCTLTFDTRGAKKLDISASYECGYYGQNYDDCINKRLVVSSGSEVIAEYTHTAKAWSYAHNITLDVSKYNTITVRCEAVTLNALWSSAGQANTMGAYITKIYCYK